MRSGLQRLLDATAACVALAGCAGCAGCAVHHPPGWAQRGERTIYPPTAGVMYGLSPRSYDLPDGDKVLISPEDHGLAIATKGASVSAGSGGVSAGLTSGVSLSSAPFVAFSVRFARSEPIQCAETEQGAGEGWFQCSTADPSILSFRQGEGSPCSADVVGPNARETLTTPDCWRGTVTIGGVPYSLERGVVTSLGVPGNSLTWVDPNNTAVLGADLVSTPAFYEMKTALARETRERLVALTFALFFHEDARRRAVQ